MNHSWPQQARRRNGKIEDRRFDTDLRLSAIHNKRDAVAEIIANVFGIGGRKAAGRIGTGRCEREAALSNHGLNERVTRPAHANGLAAGSHNVRNCFRPRQHEGQWAWPKRAGEFVGHGRPLCDAAICQLDARDVNDDRVMRRPTFDIEDPRDRFRIQRVGSQPVNRFRGQGHDLPFAPQLDRPLDGCSEQARSVGG